MELFDDRVLLLCWAVAGASAMLSLTLAPWLMSGSIRKRGLTGRQSRFRLAVACFLMTGAIPIGLLLLFGVAHPVLLVAGVAGVLGLFGSVLREPRLPVWGRHFGIIVLCNLLYLGAFQAGLGRCRVLGKRSVDGASLSTIGKALLMYGQQHGQFPDDLRRLVDEGLISENSLLPIWSDRRHAPQTKPYSGPCEFTYIPLPQDAPEGLMWVWESPQYHRGEGAWILYAWGAVKWVTPEQLRGDVDRTHAWLAARPKTLPSRGATTSAPDQPAGTRPSPGS